MPANHILIAIHDFNAGGTEHIAFRLAADWIARGRIVTILAGASDGTMRERVPEGAEVVVLDPEIPRSTLSRFRLGKAMAKRARDIAPDVVFLPGNFHFGLGASFKRRLPDTPIVGKISNPLFPQGGATPRWLTRRLLARWTQGIDALAAMSMGLNREAAEMTDGIAIATIRDPFLDDETPIAGRSGTPGHGDTLNLLAIGRLVPQKDFTLAIDAVAALNARRPVRLTILGEGSERARLERHVARRHLQHVVRLPGYAMGLNEAIDAADLLLISSAYEGGPAVAVEALARGLPFVSTDCSFFLRELAAMPLLGALAKEQGAEALANAVEDRAALPFPEAEVIASALERSRMGRASRAYLHMFDTLKDPPKRYTGGWRGVDLSLS